MWRYASKIPLERQLSSFRLWAFLGWWVKLVDDGVCEFFKIFLSWIVCWRESLEIVIRDRMNYKYIVRFLVLCTYQFCFNRHTYLVDTCLTRCNIYLLFIKRYFLTNSFKLDIVQSRYPTFTLVSIIYLSIQNLYGHPDFNRIVLSVDFESVSKIFALHDVFTYGFVQTCIILKEIII